MRAGLIEVGGVLLRACVTFKGSEWSYIMKYWNGRRRLVS